MFKKIRLWIERNKQKSLLKGYITNLCKNLRELDYCDTDLDKYDIRDLHIERFYGVSETYVLKFKAEKAFACNTNFINMCIDILDVSDKIDIEMNFIDDNQNCSYTKELLFNRNYSPLVLDASSVSSLLCICNFIEKITNRERLIRNKKVVDALKYIKR